ncbi:NepR family anti-sigma factor [uncultured Tateyamaria sp.]|uniref:NepR family anti-sigma factor n=1 Tax=uncultured Tateyamaria sp. TaxID=455651 RepID=UPI00260CDCBC|nr:NepR family anti-sigma factor [uncultured Tateyamaria sp.]
MASKQDPKNAQIDAYIDQNLKKVFAELQTGDLPDEITDLLSVLRAQDQEAKDSK